MLSQKECQHERFNFVKELTATNSPTKKKKNSFHEVPKTNEAKPDLTTNFQSFNGAHCNTIKQFCDTFSKFPEVRQVIIDGDDNCGVHEAFTAYLENIQGMFKDFMPDLSTEDYN
eukprot:TRINITY_DN48360_c0_g1_i1.p2 TRINITY_DN48360_c0_g1~~TRINITY_DN48360_c0_g1_i1.p2  ORF type:complete len:115 (-),score=26.95 TRINITY_DN48360_c0_g1_i1:717-1061(-)